MSWLTKKKNSKPSLTNSTKHLLKCPVTKPSFPPSYSLNISFKTTPKKTTNPTTKFFFVFLWKKLSPIFLPGWLDISFNRRHRWHFYTFKNICVAKLFFVTRNPSTFGQKNPLTPPTATPTTPSVTVVTTLRRRNVPNSNYYYEKNFDSQKRKKSLKEERNFTWN